MDVNKTVLYKTWHDSCSECLTLKRVNILLKYRHYSSQVNYLLAQENYFNLISSLKKACKHKSSSKFSKNVFIFNFQIYHFHKFMFLNTL